MAHLGKPKQTGKGTAYPVKWRDPDGRHRERWVYGKREAQKVKAGIEADLARGAYHDDRRGKITLAEVTDEWLASLTDAKPRTVAEYGRLLESRVLPHFGPKRMIGSIQRSHVAGYVNALKADGLRPETISRAFHPLRAALNYAAEEGYIAKSPAVRQKLPDDQSLDMVAFEARFLSWPEVERLAAECEWLHPMYGLVIRFAALTGLRPAEVAGLDVGDVHILGDRGEVAVRRTRTLTRGRGWVTSTPKTKRSTREVPLLDPGLVAELAAYLATHPRRGEAAAPLFYGRRPTGVHEFDPTRPFDPSTFYRRVFTPAATRAGVGRLRLYDLRHTYASLMASAGVDMFKVSRWMGHRSLAITDEVYAKLFKSDPDRESAALAAFLADQRKAAAAGAPVMPLVRSR